MAWLGKRAGTDGLTTYSREITRGLRERGVDVTFVHHDAASAEWGSVELPAIPVSDRWSIALPQANRRLATELKRRRIDLVHVSLSFSSLDFELPGLCGDLGIPLVATLHAPFDIHNTRWGGLSRMLYRIYSLPLARFDRVIVFGPAQRRLLEEVGVGRSVIRVVPNGVDVSRFSPGPSTAAGELGAERLFLYLGRLGAEKRVDVLLTAFLQADPPRGLRLAVAGDGKERDQLERRFRDPRIAFLGPITSYSRRVSLLRAADAFFLPSAIEGLSLAPLEAMACGECPVATDVGCDRDVVSGAGITLDPCSLGADLRAAMRLLITAPDVARGLGALARRRVMERYTLSSNLESVLALYRDVVGTGRLATRA